MGKRPSVIDQVTQPVEPTAPAPSSAEVVELKAVRQTKARPDIQHTSLYIPRAAHERLREIAFTERKKIHDLLMEGVDAVLAARGHAERTGRSEA